MKKGSKNNLFFDKKRSHFLNDAENKKESILYIDNEKIFEVPLFDLNDIKSRSFITDVAYSSGIGNRFYIPKTKMKRFGSSVRFSQIQSDFDEIRLEESTEAVGFINYFNTELDLGKEVI